MQPQHIIFLILGTVMVALLIWAPGMEYSIEESTLSFYRAIDELPAGSLVLVGADFDVENRAEILPQMEAILRHLMEPDRDLRIISISMWDQGPMVMDVFLRRIGDELGRTYGVDYVNLGYAPGVHTMIRLISHDFRGAFARDFSGTPLDELPIMDEAGGILDIPMIVDFADRESGPIIYLEQVKTQNPQIKVLASINAASFPPLEPYLQSGQVDGAVVGLKGAAEYEELMGMEGLGKRGMDAQSVGQVLVMALIIAGNVVALIIARRKKGRVVG